MAKTAQNHRRMRALIAAVAAIALAGAGFSSAHAEPFVTWPTPTISGTVAVGKTLTANYDATQFNPAPESVELVWLANDVPVGAGSTYALRPADLGKTIHVRLDAVTPDFHGVFQLSAPTAPVALGTQTFTPKISGAAAVGTTLKITGLPAGGKFTYKWKRGGKAISGATKSTYKITTKDLGKKITVTVTSTLTGYKKATKTSAATAAVKKSFSKTYAPKISGTVKVGKKLTASTKSWSPKAKLTYQWYRNGKAISGATKSTRTLSSADLGAVITVKVKGSASGYSTTTRTSAGTTAVGKGAISAKVPVVKGTAQAGKMLKATVYAPVPAGAVAAYQWYRSGVAIKGADDVRYTPQNADVGKKLTFTVTYEAKGYSAKTLTSAPTAAVAKRPAVMTGTGGYVASTAYDLQDVEPGHYYTDEATDSCRWVRDNDLNDTNGNLQTGQGKKRWIVQVLPTDAVFYTTGCGSWRPYDFSGPYADTFSGDAIFAVDIDIQSGLYAHEGAPESCFVSYYFTLTGEVDSVLTLALPGPVVNIPPYVNYFGTEGCGTWTRTGEPLS